VNRVEQNFELVVMGIVRRYLTQMSELIGLTIKLNHDACPYRDKCEFDESKCVLIDKVADELEFYAKTLRDLKRMKRVTRIWPRPEYV